MTGEGGGPREAPPGGERPVPEFLLGAWSGEGEWRAFLVAWWGVGLLLILIAAVQSDGFYHPDEHFQTLEFAGAKLGLTPWSELPWEYRYRMRSWLQPALYVAMARGAGALGVHDPFLWALGFRLASGLLAWAALVGLTLCVPRWFGEASRRPAVRALCLAFFVPFLAVRTSSESLAGSCLILGLTLLVLAFTDGERASGACPRGAAFGVGLLLGLAFEFRYAVGVAAAAVVCWALLAARVPARRLAWLAPGLGAALGLGVLVDRWGYGAWALPAREYLVRNLVDGRAALRFGDSSWYGFFVLLVLSPWAPLLLLLVTGTLLGWARKPLHPLTWATAPFLVVHCLVRHKELRFLFPVAPLCPLLLVLAVAPLRDGWDRWVGRVWGARASILARVVYALDLAVLAVLSLTPNSPQVTFQRFVRRHHPKTFEAYLATPFSPWAGNGLSMYFYRPERLVLHPLAEIEERGPARFRLVTGPFDVGVVPGYACTEVYRSFPDWLGGLSGGRVEALPAWNLHTCFRAESSRGGPPGAPP